MSAASNQMQSQRFEHKYLLTETRALEIREFLTCHMELDEHAVGKPNFSYPVHSLYLDSDGLTTYWMTINGDKNRFKLRLRFYNDHPDSPVFFEIKRRMNNCILKQRGGVRKEAVPWLLSGQLPEPEHLVSQDPKQLVALQRFFHLMQDLQAKPKVHVAYLREAWMHPENNSARVTFDRDVLAEPRPFSHFRTGLKNPVRPFRNEVILELKFTDRFPEWFRALVQHFDLFQCGAAKYCEGAEDIGLNRLGPDLPLDFGQDQGGPGNLISLEGVGR
jgi:VTC domain